MNGIQSSAMREEEAPFRPISLEVQEKIARDLKKGLGPEYASNRSGPGGTRMTYLEGIKAINLANEIFGFNGWSNRIMDVNIDYMDNIDGRISVGVSAIVRVSLSDGTFHEDIGYGSIENARTKSAAFEKAKKEAITDAMKRALKNFGNSLGACFYDKEYLRLISRIKAPKPIELKESDLFRAPQFRDGPIESKSFKNEFGSILKTDNHGNKSNSIAADKRNIQNRDNLLHSAPVTPASIIPGQNNQAIQKSTLHTYAEPATDDEFNILPGDLEVIDDEYLRFLEPETKSVNSINFGNPLNNLGNTQIAVDNNKRILPNSFPNPPQQHRQQESNKIVEGLDASTNKNQNQSHPFPQPHYNMNHTHQHNQESQQQQQYPIAGNKSNPSLNHTSSTTLNKPNVGNASYTKENENNRVHIDKKQNLMNTNHAQIHNHNQNTSINHPPAGYYAPQANLSSSNVHNPSSYSFPSTTNTSNTSDGGPRIIKRPRP